MSNQNKSRYQKTHDTLEKHLNPEGYTIGDMVLRRVRGIALLLLIGLIGNGVIWLFKKPEKPHISSTEVTNSTMPLTIEKKVDNENFTNINISSINHDTRQVTIDVTMKNANPTQTWQVREFYCKNIRFKPFIQQNMDADIKVMNENNTLAFETQIQGHDCS